MSKLKSLLAIFTVVLVLCACDFSLRLEILNAGAQGIQIAVGSKVEQVAPGLSFRGKFPAPEDHDDIIVTAGQCRYRYALPNLDIEPWRSLIGKSIKFRWFADGRLVAYPPTPDVQIQGNPQRAANDSALALPTVERVCR